MSYRSVLCPGLIKGRWAPWSSRLIVRIIPQTACLGVCLPFVSRGPDVLHMCFDRQSIRAMTFFLYIYPDSPRGVEDVICLGTGGK